jgi:hypothetical protein
MCGQLAFGQNLNTPDSVQWAGTDQAATSSVPQGGKDGAHRVEGCVPWGCKRSVWNEGAAAGAV